MLFHITTRIARLSQLLLLAASIVLLFPANSSAQQTHQSPISPATQDWPRYGGNPEANHFSPLAQIDRSNVSQLKIAWSFDTHEEGGLQSSPIIVNGILYGITPSQKIFALDAATGHLTGALLVMTLSSRTASKLGCSSPAPKPLVFLISAIPSIETVCPDAWLTPL